YRVRVGPYDNRNEAQKFLSWIQELEGFEQSYVSLVTRS
ncbi:MAG: SPOR domain-containing protein, partial [bacterium]